MNPFRAEWHFTRIDDLAAASGSWRVMFLQMGPWSSPATSTHVFTGRVLTSVTSYPGPVVVRGAIPAGACVVSTPLLAGESAFSHGRSIGDRRIVVHRRGGDVDFRSTGPVRVLAMTIESGLFEETWGTWMGEGLGPPRGRSFLLQSPRSRLPQSERLARLVNRFWPGEAHVPPAARVAALERALLKMVLDGATPFRPGRPDPGRLVAARRLERLLRGRLREAVRIHAVCEELGVPVRTVEQGFEEAFGTTPKAYLTMLRLNAIRAVLLTGRPGTSVSEVATTHGLTHHGRFSIAYRQLFGESPRETQRRGVREPTDGAVS